MRDFDPNSCMWAYGMNIFDLQEWKKQDMTQIYHKWKKRGKYTLTFCFCYPGALFVVSAMK